VKKIPKHEYVAEIEEQAFERAHGVGMMMAARDLGLVEQTLRNRVSVAVAVLP
jgi:transposase